MSTVIENLDTEASLAVVGSDVNIWGTKTNNVILNLIEPKINEIIEYTVLNNDIYGGSASSVYLTSQVLSGGGA